MLQAGALALAFAISAPAIAAEPPAGASSCSGCHAASTEVDAPVPRILGRQPAEIIAAMQAFRSGERPSTVMGGRPAARFCAGASRRVRQYCSLLLD